MVKHRKKFILFGLLLTTVLVASIILFRKNNDRKYGDVIYLTNHQAELESFIKKNNRYSYIGKFKLAQMVETQEEAEEIYKGIINTEKVPKFFKELAMLALAEKSPEKNFDVYHYTAQFIDAVNMLESNRKAAEDVTKLLEGFLGSPEAGHIIKDLSNQIINVYN